MKVLRPHTETKKQIRRKKRKNIFFIVFVIFFIVFFIWFVNQKKFKITKIIISGNKIVLSEKIDSVINKNIDRFLLFVIPRDNVFFVNTNSIEKDINNYFPEIYNVRAKIQKGSELFVEVEERMPHSIWCEDSNYDLPFYEKCFFADQKGYLYTKAPYFSSGVFEKIYVKKNDILKIGEHPMNKESFEGFFKFLSFINKKFNIRVDKIFLYENGDVKIYISSLLDKTFYQKIYLIYSSNDTYEIVERNLSLMLQHKLFKDEFKKHPERLKFIDLRIDDQIRFKFYTDEEWNSLKKTEGV
jgi:hypothetical protein